MDSSRNCTICPVIIAILNSFTFKFIFVFRRLTTEKLDVNALLTKYARASKVDGVKCYSSKHGK